MTGFAPFATPAPIDRWVDRECAANRLSGGVIELRQRGETVYARCFGTASDAGDPVTPDTVYWIASMTKPVVSAAALRLIEDGRLMLGDPLAAFVPGFGAAGVLTAAGGLVPAERPATVLDAMTHRSGVTYGAFGAAAIHARYGAAGGYDFANDNATMAARLAALPLLHQPGRVFEYGMSTDLLGRVIEVVTGQPLEDALRALVLAPLGMADTRFRPDPARLAALPPSPTQQALAPPFTADQRWCSGGGGLTSTVADYLRFAEMLRGGGAFQGIRVLRPQTVALMLRDHLPADVGHGPYTAALGITAPWDDNGLGFGLGVAVRTARRPHLPGGLGEFFWPGVSGANFWVDPEQELTAILLTHAPEHRGQQRVGFRSAVYAALGRWNEELGEENEI